MKILVTNDDGIYADGIRSLVDALKDIGELFVVAPNRQRSASGHSITMHEPLRAEKVNFFGMNIPAWAVSGTPTDCVKLGVEALIKEKPDLILSGINRGSNLGTDVLYSGTVSAAIEGAMLGFPSIAVSLAFNTDWDYSVAANFSKKLGEYVYNNILPPDTLINVNVPNNSEPVRGVKVATLGVRKYNNSFIERIDPHGQSYYWLGGEISDENNNEETDIWCIKNNYISITPIHFDLTKHSLIKELQSWSIEL